MKVAHLTATFPPYRGGMGNVAAQLAWMYSLHHEVTVFTPRYRGVISSRDVPAYRVEWLKSPIKYGNAAWLPQLLWRLRSFDLVYLHYPFYGAHLAVLLACSFWQKKLIIHYHMDSLSPGFKGFIFEFNRRFIFPMLVKRADIIIGASLDYLEHSKISPFYTANPKKFREIPFWVDTGKFHPADNVLTGEIIVLFVGGLDQAHYFKGFENLLYAMKTVIMKCSKAILLRVVGSGDLLGFYQKLASELDIADHVEFLGKADGETLVRAYQEASFLVLPSINQGEAFGLVLLEAMSSGKPVIASNLPGVRSVFHDGKEGLVAGIGDTEELAEKILLLAENDELRSRMGWCARQRVLKKYQAGIVEQELKALWRQLLEK
jgi:glycosyltransferase involved in cell wall biosynthesis